MSDTDEAVLAPLESGSTRTNRRIFRALLLVAAGTIAIRLLGLVKSRVIAFWFGTGDGVEAFNIASALLVYMIVVLSNSLPSAFVPVFAEVRARGGERAARALVREVMGWSILVLCLGSVVLGLIWPLYLGSVDRHFSPEKNAESSRLFWILLPSLLLNGLTVLLVAALNAEKRFRSTVLTPGVVPIAIALSTWLYAREHGAQALAFGHLAGVALELLVVATIAVRSGFSISPAWPRRTAGVRLVVGQYLPLIGGSLLMRSTTVVDQSMAATLPASNLAALGYASVAIAAVLSITAASLGTAALPHLSDLAAARDWRGMRASLGHWTRLVLLVSIPATIVFWYASDAIIALIYENGLFGEDDSAAVGRIFAMYALQVPFYTVGLLCSRVLSALRANHLLMWIAGINVVVNVTLNWLFMRTMGAAGIALSTSCVYFLSCIALWVVVERRLAHLRDASPLA